MNKILIVKFCSPIIKFVLPAERCSFMRVLQMVFLLCNLWIYYLLEQRHFLLANSSVLKVYR